MMMRKISEPPAAERSIAPLYRSKMPRTTSMPSTCGFFGSNSLCTRSFTELFVAGVRFFCFFCAEYTASNVMRFPPAAP